MLSNHIYTKENMESFMANIIVSYIKHCFLILRVMPIYTLETLEL